MPAERSERLRELLAPKMKAVLVGINPSDVSAAAGHYHQGAHSKWMWQRFEEHESLRTLPDGAEDICRFL